VVLQVEILKGEGRCLIHPESVVIDHSEECPVSKGANSGENRWSSSWLRYLGSRSVKCT